MADLSDFDIPRNEIREIDGLAVLRRIIDGGGRLRQDTFNNGMLEAAELAGRRILLTTKLTPEDEAKLRALCHRMAKVLAARRKRRYL